MVVLFKSWINDKYIEWRGNSRSTLTDFAKYLGVSQQIMNQWINEGALPGTRTLPKLAAKYPDVYEVLGLPAPAPEISDETLRPLAELLLQLPEDERNEAHKQIEDMLIQIVNMYKKSKEK